MWALPAVAWWGLSALGAGIGAALPILAAGKAADDAGDAVQKASPIIIAGIGLGLYLLLKRK